MSNKRLRRIPAIHEDVCEQLSKYCIFTCKDVLSKDLLELLHASGSYEKAKFLLKTVSSVTAPESISAYHLLVKQKSHFIATSLLKVDEVLHGGLPSGTITEITGPPGCGKTQFCMMLSALAAMDTRFNNSQGDGHVIYIDTENAFTGTRLMEIIENRILKGYPSVTPNEVACQVLVYFESTCNSLMERLGSIEDVIISKNVKLIILDSIASLARKEFGQTVINERNQLLMKQATQLKYYADNFNIPVLVTNQVTSRMKNDFSGDSFITAALGNTWSHAVNTRLLVQFVNEDTRELIVGKSPIAPAERFLFKVDASGIVLTED